MSLKTPIAPRASPQILSDIPFRKPWICPGYMLLAPPLNQPLHGTMEIHGSFHVFILSHACLSITHADDYNCVNRYSIGVWGQICQTVKLKSLPNVLCTHVCYYLKQWEYFYEFLMFTMVAIATKNKLAYLFKKPNDTHSVSRLC